MYASFCLKSYVIQKRAFPFRHRKGEYDTRINLAFFFFRKGGCTPGLCIWTMHAAILLIIHKDHQGDTRINLARQGMEVSSNIIWKQVFIIHLLYTLKYMGSDVPDEDISLLPQASCEG
jgi:hypothetical protein